MVGTEQIKFAELRARTDRELAALISRRVYAMVACLLSESKVNGNIRAAAERVYAEAASLIPRIYDLPADKRKQLETRLAKLRALLDEEGMRPELRAFAAC
jgi:hypothetical protein